NQNRDGNAEQPQEKITAHWMISDWISSLNECRFLERVPLLAVSPTRASLACVRLGTDFQPQRSWLAGEGGRGIDKRNGFFGRGRTCGRRGHRGASGIFGDPRRSREAA